MLELSWANHYQPSVCIRISQCEYFHIPSDGVALGSKAGVKFSHSKGIKTGLSYSFSGEFQPLLFCYFYPTTKNGIRGSSALWSANKCYSSRQFYWCGSKSGTKFGQVQLPSQHRDNEVASGSPMYSQPTDLPQTIRLRLGTITGCVIPESNYQIYCKSKSQ